MGKTLEPPLLCLGVDIKTKLDCSAGDPPEDLSFDAVVASLIFYSVTC